MAVSQRLSMIAMLPMLRLSAVRLYGKLTYALPFPVLDHQFSELAIEGCSCNLCIAAVALWGAKKSLALVNRPELRNGGLPCCR